MKIQLKIKKILYYFNRIRIVIECNNKIFLLTNSIKNHKIKLHKANSKPNQFYNVTLCWRMCTLLVRYCTAR